MQKIPFLYPMKFISLSFIYYRTSNRETSTTYSHHIPFSLFTHIQELFFNHSFNSESIQFLRLIHWTTSNTFSLIYPFSILIHLPFFNMFRPPVNTVIHLFLYPVQLVYLVFNLFSLHLINK